MVPNWIIVIGLANGVGDWLKGLNNLFTSIPQVVVGSHESMFGGVNLLRDSRQYAIFQWAGGSLPERGELYYMNENVEACPPEEKREIHGIEELDNWPESWLECLLLRGKAPTEILPGFYYGKVNSWLGNDMFTDLANALWGGVIVSETRCDGLNSTESKYIGMNQVGTSAAVASWNYLGDTQNFWPIYEKVRQDDKGWWWMDWSVDFASVCPSRVPDYYDSAGESGSERDRTFPLGPAIRAGTRSVILPGRLPNLTGGPGSYFKSQLYTSGSLNPPSQIIRDRIAQLRIVGFDHEVNSTIYLGRLLTLFPEGLRPTAFFTLVF